MDMGRPSRREALALLYERHYGELVRLAFALTSDWGLAEELAQEAFVRVWRSWGNIHDQQSAPRQFNRRGQPVQRPPAAARHQPSELDQQPPRMSKGHLRPRTSAQAASRWRRS
jgi:Sigma-70 region 2